MTDPVELFANGFGIVASKCDPRAIMGAALSVVECLEL
jgi:hypothetical protein